jgi:hypothetical protein
MPEQIGTFAINSSGVESFDIMFWPHQGEEGYRICKAKTLEQLATIMQAVGCPLTEAQIELARGHQWIGRPRGEGGHSGSLFFKVANHRRVTPLIGSKDGGWVYTNPKAEAKMEFPATK